MLNTPTFHLEEKAEYYERASYTWSSDSLRLTNTVSQNARSHFLYVQECGYFKTASPYYTERAALPSYLILYTLSGNGRLTFLNRSFSLSAGSCCYIDCREAHRYEAVGNDVWEFLWLHFSGANAPGYYQEFSAFSMPVLSIQDTFLIESTLRRIVSVCQKKAVYAEALTACCITNIITEVLIQAMTASHTHFHLPDVVQEAVSLLHAHFKEPLTLDEIASRVNVSKYHLSREFSKYMGLGINQYLINCRISYAKELLRDSSLSVEAIAFQSGMNHVSHFIRLFKDREGVTPLKYRELWGVSTPP